MSESRGSKRGLMDSRATSFDGLSIGGSSDQGSLSSASAMGNSKVKSAEESLFSVLFTLTQHGKSGKFVPFASFVIDFLQMIGFVFSSNFPWGSLTQNSVSKLVSAVQLQVPLLMSGYSDFLVIFWIVVTVIMLAVADVVYVSRMFKKNEFSHMWPVKFLRFFVSLLVTVFFIPFFNVLLTPLDCHYTTNPPGLDAYVNIACWSPVNAFHSAVAIVAAVTFALFSLIVVLVFVDPDPTANQPLSTPHSFFDLLLLVSRIILSLASTFLSQHVGWLAAINFIIHASSFAAVVYMCPYFMLVVTRLRSGFFAVLAFASAVLVGVVQNGSTQSEVGSYVFMAGCIPAFCLGYWLPLWRLKRLCRAAVDFVEPQTSQAPAFNDSHGATWFSPLVSTARSGSTWLTHRKRQAESPKKGTIALPGATQTPQTRLVFKTILEVELATRFLQHDTSKACLDMATKIFEHGNTMFPNSPLLLLMHASFAQFYLKNLQTAQPLVEKANSLNPYFGFRFLVYRKRREMYTKGEIDMISAVDFKRHYAGAHKSHLLCVKAMVRLWRQLLPNKVNVVALPEVLETIYQAEERAEMHFKQLLRKYKSPRVLRAYGSFLADCKNNQGMAMKYFAAAEDMEEDHEHVQEDKKLPTYEAPTFPMAEDRGSILSPTMSALDLQSSPGHDIFNATSAIFSQYAVILLGGHGEILHISPQASHFLSVDTLQMFGQKFSSLCLCPQSANIFDSMVEHAATAVCEDGVPTMIADGFLVLSQPTPLLNVASPKYLQSASNHYIPVCHQTLKLASERLFGDHGGWALALVFDRAQVGEKRGQATVDHESHIFSEVDESFANYFGYSQSDLIGMTSDHLLHSVGCSDHTNAPQLIFSDGHPSYCHMMTTHRYHQHSHSPQRSHTSSPTSEHSRVPSLPSSSAQPTNNGELTNQTSSSSLLSMQLFPLYIPHDSPLASGDLVGNPMNAGEEISSVITDPEFVSSPQAAASRAPASSAGGEKEPATGSFRKKRYGSSAHLAASVASSDQALSNPNSSAMRSILDDNVDTHKKSTVAIFHRNIRIGLIVMACFAIACYVTMNVLAGQTRQTLKNERDAGMLSTYSQRMVTQARTLQLYPRLATMADVLAAQDYLRTLEIEFYDMVYRVYYLGEQRMFGPLHDEYYRPAVTTYQMGAAGNVTTEMSSVWVVERLYAYHSKIIANLKSHELLSRMANASYFYVCENGPYGVKDALAQLTHGYKEFSLYSINQILLIESLVSASSIAVLIGLVVVVQMSLRLVHKDKVHSIDLFLMIPKHVIQELLNRKYFILDEINELSDEATTMWQAQGGQTPTSQPRTVTSNFSQPDLTRMYLQSDLPPLPPIPPPTSANPTTATTTINTVRFLNASMSTTTSRSHSLATSPLNGLFHQNTVGEFSLQQQKNIALPQADFVLKKEGNSSSVSQLQPFSDSLSALAQNLQNPNGQAQGLSEGEEGNRTIGQCPPSPGFGGGGGRTGAYRRRPSLTPLSHSPKEEPFVLDESQDGKNPALPQAELALKLRRLSTKKPGKKHSSSSFDLKQMVKTPQKGRKEKRGGDEDENDKVFDKKKPTENDSTEAQSTQKVSKKLKKALASPAVRVFTRRYGLIVIAIATLLITSLVLAFQSINEISVICTEIDLSSSRNYLSVHIRHLARELIITKSKQIAEHIKETIAHLIKVHNALLYGDDSMGVPGSALRYGPQETMLYGQGCFRENKAYCPKPDDPYYVQLNAGLATLLRDYLEVMLRFVDSPVEELTFANPDFDFIFNIVIFNIRDGLQILTDLYLQEATSLLEQSVSTQLYITLSILFLLVLVYAVVFRPMIRFIRDETRRTCTMLLMLPPELVSEMSEIRSFINDKQAELSEKFH